MRLRALRASGLLIASMGGVVLCRCIDLGIWTTGAASVGLIVAGLIVTAGRTFGVPASLVVGASFATSAALGMTDAPALFLLVAALTTLPALLAARPMVRFDRAATIVALGVALVVGSMTAAGLRYAGPSIIVHLARGEAAVDLSADRWIVRLCGPRRSASASQLAEVESAGIEVTFVECGAFAPRDHWNAAYNASMFEGERAWAHRLALGTDPPL